MNTERARKYITPGLAKYDSLKKLEGHDPIFFSFLSGYAGNSFLFEDFFIEKRCFVAAEPGWGKTRLLKEIIVEAAKKGKPGIFIDLKKAGKDHETFLSKPLNITETITAGISGQKLKEMTLFKTGNFDLKDPDDSIICLDALDEVKQQDFADVVDQIKYLSKKMKNTHIVISCRTHHLKKNANLFHNMDFIYIAIEDFDEDKIKQYLGESGLTAGQIKKIHDILESGNRQLPISVPRYLEILIDFVDKEGVDSLEKLTRGELLDFFIYRKLECEEDKIKKQHKDITKRVLEKLALLMEIYQTNTLTKDELMSFFDDVKSGLKNNFLQQVKLEVFYDRSLIKDNIDTVEFENTSFQEFLAAKEILRLGRTEQVIFDLAVDKELREIYPAWLDTLEFVIDLDISILKPILDFASSRSETINTEECYRLLTTMNTNRLSLDQRKEIFKTVLDYYQQKSACIDLGVARKLSYYFDISQDELLKGYIDKRKSSGSVPATRKGNVAEVIAYLFENDKLDNRRISYWKNKLIEFACDKNPGLNRTALSALSKLKDLKVLQKIYHLFQRHDELTNQVFLQACIEINPNDPFSIDCFIIGGKKGNIFAHSGLEQITERKAIIYLLDRLINKKDHFYRFVDPSYNRYSGNKYDTIFQNIRNVYDPGIEKKMVTLANAVISDSFSHYFRFSDFTAHVLKLIREKNKSYIFDLIADEKLLDNIQSKYSIFEHIFSLLLRKEQIDRFVKELEPLAIKRNIALNSLYKIKNSDRTDATEIYEEGRKHFDEEYKQFIDDREKPPVDVEYPNRKLYEQFRHKLEPEPGKYYPDVFSFYLENKEKISSHIKEVDKERLKELITHSFFEVFDPGEQKLFMTERSENSFRASQHLWQFGDCIRIASELNIDISKYKEKIINFIPFAFNGRHSEAVFFQIPEMSEQEINTLLNVYNGTRDDDLAEFHPENLIKAVKKYKILKAVPILKRLVEKYFQVRIQESALKAIASIQPDEKYFKNIFQKYQTKNDKTFGLAELANQYLVEKYEDKEAIRWRFDQLIIRNHPFREQNDIHAVGAQEHELSHKEFASPIMNLKTHQYIENFFELLDKSFEIYEKGEDYFKYANYLWEITLIYFRNLKEHRSYEPLKKLEDFVKGNKSRGGLNWFTERLRELKREYLKYIGKPQHFSDCIKKYNHLKERQYIDIATSRDLFEILKDIIETDLRRWVEGEGAYKFIRHVKGQQEDLIQKTIKTQFENCLLKRGFRDEEINIQRESHLLDNMRTDFLIYYGFIGPVLIETKRLDNDEIKSKSKRQRYSKKLKKYMEGTGSEFGIYLIFKIKEGLDLDTLLTEVRATLKDYNDISVIGLDCIREAEACE